MVPDIVSKGLLASLMQKKQNVNSQGGPETAPLASVGPYFLVGPLPRGGSFRKREAGILGS